MVVSGLTPGSAEVGVPLTCMVSFIMMLLLAAVQDRIDITMVQPIGEAYVAREQG